MNKEAGLVGAAVQVTPIGHVDSSEKDFSFSLQINEEYRPGLKHLDMFSHCIVMWWAHNSDTADKRKEIQTPLPYADNVVAGVFACRAEYRPNPIAVTTCAILDVDEKSGIVKLEYIDAFNGSPVLDIKPYIPVSDRVRDVTGPEWFEEWPDWYEEAGEFFSKFFGAD